jgi:dienelactone hydrolase
MVLSHDSSGFKPDRLHNYVVAFNDMGVAVLGIDHFGPRGITSTAADQSLLSPAQMARDELAALDALAQNPRIDASRAGVAGFSKGGGAVWRAALRKFNRSPDAGAHRFALFLAFYPFCGDFFRDLRTTGAPIRFLVGADDDYVGAAQCVELAQRMREAGGDAETIVYPGASHAFDYYQDAPGLNAMPWTSSRDCFFDEQDDGRWRERSHGVYFRWEDPASRDLGLRACTHPGVHAGANLGARAGSLERAKREVARSLLGAPSSTR